MFHFYISVPFTFQAEQTKCPTPKSIIIGQIKYLHFIFRENFHVVEITTEAHSLKFSKLM